MADPTATTTAAQAYIYELMKERLTTINRHLVAAHDATDPAKDRTAPELIRGEFASIDKVFAEFQMLRNVYLLVRGVRS